MTAGWLTVNLAVAVAIVIGTITVLRWSPLVALILGSLAMGLTSGLGVVETVDLIAAGFGKLMAGIGLSVGLGVIIGRLLYDCGGAHAVASSVVRRVPESWVFYGIGLTAFLFSIPVFFDVTFVILIPLALTLSVQLGKPIPYAVGATVIGAAAAHTLVPPTPNPLAAASILEFDPGVMVIAGLAVGVPAALLAMKILFVLLDAGLWAPTRDESPEMAPPPEHSAKGGASARLALVPIGLAVFLILFGTLWKAVVGQPPPWVRFLSDRVVAMLLGTIAAYLVAARTLTRREQEASASQAMAAAGVVLLVTGAGGAFGGVIEATGIGDALASGVAGSAHSRLWAVLATYGIATVFRVSQGSGTVASITAMTLIAGAGLAQTVGLHPVWLALAALAGGISLGHVNDSGFWVTAKLSGLTLTGGLKTYTLGELIVSILVLIISLGGSIALPELVPGFGPLR